MKHLGIDYGSKRIGLALSDDAGKFALPKKVIETRGAGDPVDLVAAFMKENKVDAVVIGESRDYKGTKNKIMLQASTFAEELAQRTGVPVHMEPEFMTSHQASRTQHELGGDGETVDASAAAIILQSFLDRRSQ